MMRFILMLPLFLLAACGSSKEPDYYTLAPIAGAAAPGAPLTVKILRPSLPEALNRPDMVQMRSDYTVTRRSDAQWAEPLDTMIARVLAADLSTRLPAGSAVVTEGGGIDATAPYLVEIEIQAFGEDGGQVRLSGQLAVKDTDGSPVSPMPFDMPVKAASGTRGFVASASQALATLADRAAAEIQAAASRKTLANPVAPSAVVDRLR